MINHYSIIAIVIFSYRNDVNFFDSGEKCRFFDQLTCFLHCIAALRSNNTISNLKYSAKTCSFSLMLQNKIEP